MSTDETPRPGAPVEAAPQQDPADAARARRLNNATTFLKNPQVRASPLERRVNFLKSKGLSASEIVEAFSRAGQSQSLEAIEKIINSAPAAATKSSAPAGLSLPPSAAPTVGVPNQQPQIIYVQQPPPQPHATAAGHAAPAAAPPKPPAWGWKDYFIGATLAAAGAVSAVKAVQYFAPFDIVWREDGAAGVASPMSTRSARSGASFRDARGASSTSAASKGRRAGKHSAEREQRTSSDSELPAEGRAPRSSRATAAAPSAGAETAAAPPPPPAASAAATVAAPPAAEQEIAALRKSVEEVTEKLDKERRERAEMAVSSAKLKGQVTSLSRANEKSAAEITRLAAANAALKEELEKLRAAAEPPSSPPVTETAAAGEVVPQAPPPAASDPTVSGPPASDPATAAAGTGGAQETGADSPTLGVAHADPSQVPA